MHHIDTIMCSIDAGGVRLHIRGALFHSGGSPKCAIFTREIRDHHHGGRPYTVATDTLPFTAIKNIWMKRCTT